jgi:ABC-2 type transport system ATP-binding protein
VAVDDLSLTVRPGEICGLLGPNGAGKTTTIMVVAGQTEPDRGESLICGHDIQIEALAAKAKLGFVPQEPFLYRYLTADEFLRFVADVHGVDAERRDRRITDELTRFNLLDVRSNLIGEYSTGMAKKVAVAAALLADPPVLVLDEVFAGLDPPAVTVLKKRLAEKRAAGAAVLLASHDLETVAEVCNRVAILAKGTLRSCLDAGVLEAARDGEGKNLETLFLEAAAAQGDGDEAAG